MVQEYPGGQYIVPVRTPSWGKREALSQPTHMARRVAVHTVLIHVVT